jgi:hypothetical protein
VGRHEDDREPGAGGVQPRDEVEAAEPGQPKVGEHCVAPLLTGEREAFLGGLRGDHKVAVVFEDTLKPLGSARIVFDQQDCPGAART